MPRAPQTSVDTAYDQLRDRLIAFRVKPGARLNESEIAADLSMSRAPVREALNRLIADGLVRFEAGRGFFCRRLSAREMTELYAVRFDLESGALRVALDAPPDALEGFTDTWRRDLGQAGDSNAEGLIALDEAFHLGLAALGGNEARLKFLGNINDRIRFVRRINLETQPRRLDALAEHDRLLDAIASGDRPGAIDVLRTHLQRSTDEVQTQIRTALARIYADDVA